MARIAMDLRVGYAKTVVFWESVMNYLLYIVTFNNFEQAKKNSEEYLIHEHLLFENMILIDELGLDSLILAADLESYFYEVQNNCCFAAIPINRSKQLLTKLLRILTKFVPLLNQKILSQTSMCLSKSIY